MSTGGHAWLSLNEIIPISVFYVYNELLTNTSQPWTIEFSGSDTSLSSHHPAAFGNVVFPKKILYFGRFTTPSLSDSRSVVFIKGGAHRNYFSGTNFYLQIFIENRTTSHAEYCSKLRDKYHVAMNPTEPHPQGANQEQDKTCWRIIR